MMGNPTDTHIETASIFLQREGVGDLTCHRHWFKNKQVLVNGTAAEKHTPVQVGDTMTVRGHAYHIIASNEPGRPALKPAVRDDGRHISGRVRVHCGYHKCLTMYFRRVSKKTTRWHNPLSGTSRHFFHRADEFYIDCDKHTVTSVSGNFLDLDRFDDIRVVHIIRDPRDMIVSGYFYHKRGAEHWCDYVNPTDDDWRIVNAPVPSALPKDTSFTEYLNTVSQEDGLAAEFEFRQRHFESMMSWPINDPRVMTIKYEDILGDEPNALQKIYEFFEFPAHTRWAARHFADRYSAKSRRKLAWHIRNPNSGQWQDLFSPALTRRFDDLYGGLLEKYGY